MGGFPSCFEPTMVLCPDISASFTLRSISTAINRGKMDSSIASRQLATADHVFGLNMSIFKINIPHEFLDERLVSSEHGRNIGARRLLCCRGQDRHVGSVIAPARRVCRAFNAAPCALAEAQRLGKRCAEPCGARRMMALARGLRRMGVEGAQAVEGRASADPDAQRLPGIHRCRVFIG